MSTTEQTNPYRVAASIAVYPCPTFPDWPGVYDTRGPGHIDDRRVLRVNSKRHGAHTTFGVMVFGPEFADDRDVPERDKELPLTGSLQARAAVLASTPQHRPPETEVQIGDRVILVLHDGTEPAGIYLVEIVEDRALEGPRLLFLYEQFTNATGEFEMSRVDCPRWNTPAHNAQPDEDGYMMSVCRECGRTVPVQTHAGEKFPRLVQHQTTPMVPQD